MSEDTGFEDAVAKYVALRDVMREREEAHKAAMAELQAEQEEYTAIILATCNQLGADSLRTAAGTVTRKVVSRYWTSDWEAMHAFVLENADAGGLELLERRIHNGNLRQFLADNPDRMPAGLQSDSRYTIQVRKPTNK
jgi:hypothetical protein